MKQLTILFTCLLFVSFAMAQKNNPNYDAELANKLGADDYGMKKFILVMLKTGSNTSSDETEKNEAFNGHMLNMERLVKEKILIVAGPIGKNDKTYRGIFILDVATIEKAEEITSTDPAIKAGYLEAEIYNWYGSAALSEYLEASDKIWKISP